MKRILIVDDKPDNLYLLRVLLKGSGYAVDEARHGAEALTKARQAPPVIIISDLLMPVMDGYTLLRQWKADERLREIPFVVYTATYTDPKDERLALDLGADAFILKPAEPEPFIIRIREVLEQKRRGELMPPRVPQADEKILLKEYNAALIQKLEEKAQQLEQTNQALQEDIARREQVEAVLRESQQTLATLISNLPGAVFRVRNDANYTAEYVSDQIAALTGYPADDFRENRRNFGELMYPDDRDRVWNETQKALGEHRPYEVSYRFIDAHGREKWNWEKGRGIFDANGELQAVEGFVQDITTRKLAEQKLRVSARQLETLSRRLLAAQEDERRNVARELHDEIGQLLTVVKLDLQTVLRQPGTAALAPALKEGMESIDRVVARVRDLSLDLRPSMLDDLGLAPALRWLVQRQAQRLGAEVKIGLTLPPALARLPGEIETACFRIAQEALTNATRHAQARRIEVKLETSAKMWRLTVSDDGAGFDIAVKFRAGLAGGGFGLLGMQERAELAGGEFSLDSAPGRGTTVEALFPILETGGNTP